MQAKRLRDWFVEAKLYVNRTAGYLSILNFLMIALVFLNTTVWDYDFFQKTFPDRKLFLLTGFVVVIIFTVLVGYFDTKLKMWRTESEKTLDPERNPALVPIAFQSAKLLNDLKKQGKNTKDLEENLNHMFSRCKLSKEFEFFKEQTK
jgi:hypothetical protein